MEFIVLLAAICAMSMIVFLLRLTFSVSRHDPKFAAKAFVSGLASSSVGYLIEGRVEIKLILWGIGGLILYVAYKFGFDHS
jgi:hypothetical protein